MMIVDEMKFYEKTYNGDIEEGAVLLGQTIRIIDKIESVLEIIDSIVSGAEKSLLSTSYRIEQTPIELELII